MNVEMASTRRLCLVAVFFCGLLPAGDSAAQSYPRTQVSDAFRLETAKPLRGDLVECDGTVIGSTTIQLLDDEKKFIRSITSSTIGEYDFGVLSQGRYRIRVNQMVQTGKKPRVICTVERCRIAPLPVVNQLRPEANPPGCR
jgi:hypothetical protein